MLVTHDWTTRELADLAAFVDEQHQAFVLELVANLTLAYGLVDEIGRSAEEVSNRVRAVKEYAYLDQGPVQVVDVHQGLETTLVMLRHKLPPAIVVRREYAPDLPPVEAYGSELNQVWTNLIDNALDAMGAHGELVLCTSHGGGVVSVEIVDSGPGIRAELLPHIFDIGFTTKAPGMGSGRGLHIARSIVEDKHRGQLAIASRPGETRFQVTLPVTLAQRPPAPKRA